MNDEKERRRVTIIGMGLIGASLGLALKEAGVENLEVVGHDRERRAANRAKDLRAIDKAEHNLGKAVRDASMVVIATPVLAVREVMADMAPDLAEGAVVTDTASTKAEVMRWADELLPKHVSFVGGHPMAGKESSGVENAEAKLYAGKAYCICPSVGAEDWAVKSVVGLTHLVGAEPLFVDAAEHDQYAAAASHLPLLLSTALFTLLRSSPGWEDMAPMASSGFKDATRLASGDPVMGHDICVTNREALTHWLDRMAEELKRYRNLLQDAKDEELMKALAGAQADRDAFLAEPVGRRREEPVRTGDIRQQVLDSFMGSWAASRLRRARRLSGIEKDRDEEEPELEGGKRRPSLAEKIAEDIRRDLEKLSEKKNKTEE